MDMSRSTRVFILIKNIYTVYSGKRFFPPVTYFSTNLVYPFTLQGLLAVCNQYRQLFYDENLNFSNAVKHSIPTTDNIPVHAKTLRYPYIHKEVFLAFFTTEEIFEIIQEAYSKYFAGTNLFKILRCVSFFKEPSSNCELESLI